MESHTPNCSAMQNQSADMARARTPTPLLADRGPRTARQSEPPGRRRKPAHRVACFFPIDDPKARDHLGPLHVETLALFV